MSEESDPLILRATLASIILYHISALALHRSQWKSVIPGIWFDLDFHRLILAAGITYFQFYPAIFFVDYAGVHFALTVMFIHHRIAPKLGQTAQHQVQLFTGAIVRSMHFHRSVALIQIIIAPYLFCTAVRAREVALMILSLFYFHKIVLLAYATDVHHRFIWHTSSQLLLRVAGDSGNGVGYPLVTFVAFCGLFGRFAESTYQLANSRSHRSFDMTQKAASRRSSIKS
jgi:hypothetical protein